MTAGKWRDEKTLDKLDEQEPNGQAGMAGIGTEVTKHHKTQPGSYSKRTLSPTDKHSKD